MENDLLNFSFQPAKEQGNIIKVIGVGGGGSNAVNHMFRQGVKGVDFIVCNTDAQALDLSPVPYKVQLGSTLTEGRGAGSLPEIGKNAAIENISDIRDLLGTQTKMAFITAGMGGGTGTGGAPVIAAAAKEMGILTVGIVTVPFSFEGKKRKMQADAGLEELKKSVDTLIIICNDKLREMYGNLRLTEAFGHADDVVTTAAKGISDIITTTLHINTDFADIETVLRESGVAIMGSATASGENRSMRAIELALNSPLLNDNDIVGARYVLLNITSGNAEFSLDELGEIVDYVQEAAGQTADIIQGYGIDPSLGDAINVTIIATGFKDKANIVIPTLVTKKPEKVVLSLIEETPAAPAAEVQPQLSLNTAESFAPELNTASEVQAPTEVSVEFELPQRTTTFEAEIAVETSSMEPTLRTVSPSDKVELSEAKKLSDERITKLRNFTYNRAIERGDISELENIPAYKRRNVVLDQQPHSSESQVSRFSLGEDEQGKPELRDGNNFVHGSVD